MSDLSKNSEYLGRKGHNGAYPDSRNYGPYDTDRNFEGPPGDRGMSPNIVGPLKSVSIIFLEKLCYGLKQACIKCL